MDKDDIMIKLAKEGKYDEFMQVASEDIDYNNGTALRISIKYTDLNLVKKVVEAGANIYIRRSAPIIVACESLKVDILEYLLEKCENMPLSFQSIIFWTNTTESPNKMEKSKLIISAKEIYEEKGWSTD